MCAQLAHKAQTCHPDRSRPMPLLFSFAPAEESVCAAEEPLFDLSHKPLDADSTTF